jgi:hypothetical protein
MSSIDRDASYRAESLEHEALAPSSGASTTRILTVRYFKRPHRSRSPEAAARTRSLVLSSVFKERHALTAHAQRRSFGAGLAGPAPAWGAVRGGGSI